MGPWAQEDSEGFVRDSHWIRMICHGFVRGFIGVVVQCYRTRMGSLRICIDLVSVCHRFSSDLQGSFENCLGPVLICR